MTTIGRICDSLGCLVQVPESLKKERRCLDHYLEETFSKLAVTTEQFHRGQDIDDQTADWLRSQVDRAVELLTEDPAAENVDQRCMLLELLLGIANLNECVRHNGVLAQHTSRHTRQGVPKRQPS